MPWCGAYETFVEHWHGIKALQKTANPPAYPGTSEQSVPLPGFGEDERDSMEDHRLWNQGSLDSLLIGFMILAKLFKFGEP